MGIYYYLLNDTKKQMVAYDSYVKAGPIQYNEAVHMAIVNYLFENRYDRLRFVEDCGGAEEMYDYEEVNLRKYKYENEKVIKLIEEKIQRVENREAPPLAQEARQDKVE